jgi:hypothetical protein
MAAARVDKAGEISEPEIAPVSEDQELLREGNEREKRTIEAASEEVAVLVGKVEERKHSVESKQDDTTEQNHPVVTVHARKLDCIVRDDDDDDAEVGVFEDTGSAYLSLKQDPRSKLQFKPVSTWASAPDQDDEPSHPFKKPNDKKIRPAVSVKKTGKNKAARMKPQHADDSSVVKINKANKKKGEVTFTKKTGPQRTKKKRLPQEANEAMSGWLDPFAYKKTQEPEQESSATPQ